MTDTETIGYLQNRGWDKDIKAAALGAIKAHREAEKHLGVPVDRRVDLPKDANDEAGWKSVFQKLGAPPDAKGYDFAGIKFKDGTDLSDDFKSFISEKAAAANLTKAQASAIAKAWVEHNDNAGAADAAETEAKLLQEKADLDKNWGTNKPIHMNTARLGAQRLGVTPQEVEALEKVVGYSRVMEMFRKVGASTKEDSWVQGGSGNGNTGLQGPLTKEMAVARKAELMTDKDWSKRWLDGGQKEQREMLNLNSIILGGASE